MFPHKSFYPKRLDITFCNIFEQLYELTLELVESLVDSEFVECSFVVEIVEVFDYLDFCNHSP
jgi:hypothetical protein